jgi:hypothetical protein
MHPRRQTRFDEPADPRQHGPGDRPLLTVAVVGQQDGACTVASCPGDHAREEWHTVLSVDDHVRTLAAHHVPPCARIHGQSSAATAVAHPVALLRRRRAGIAGGAERHRMALSREVFGDTLEIDLTTTAFRVAGVAPTQQENLHDRSHDTGTASAPRSHCAYQRVPRRRRRPTVTEQCTATALCTASRDLVLCVAERLLACSYRSVHGGTWRTGGNGRRAAAHSLTALL